MYLRFLFFIALFVNLQQGVTQCLQAPTGNSKVAKNYVTFGQFTCALKEYLILYKEKPNSVKINRALATCYAGIPGKTGKGIKYAEFVIGKGKYNAEDMLILIMGYHRNHDFDKAIKTAQRYIQEFKPVDLELAGIEKIISNCKSAQELMKFPLKINFENLGANINTEWDESTPYSSPNESVLMFTTTRKNVMGGFSFGNGFLSDIFTTKLKGKKYSKPRSIGTMFNSIDVDEFAGTSADGKYLFVSTDSEGFQIFNLKMSFKKPRARSFPKPVNLDGINSNTTNERSATINNEGTIIIFASDREGGKGGYDLWLSRKLPDNTWGIPVNLGDSINSSGDEIFPQFNATQDGILFASEGHLNMGGLDIFSASFSNDYTSWSVPRNLGYPINTVFDDYTIQYLQKNRIAYKADYRDDSFGMSDIYRLTFLDSTPQYSILNVEVKAEDHVIAHVERLKGEKDTSLIFLDSLMTLSPAEDSLTNKVLVDSVNQVILAQTKEIEAASPNCFAEISVTNSATEEAYGDYKSNPLKGGILMILEPGKYDLSVQAKGYKPLNKSLIIRDKTLFKRFLKKEFVLKKK